MYQSKIYCQKFWQWQWGILSDLYIRLEPSKNEYPARKKEFRFVRYDDSYRVLICTYDLIVKAY